MDVREIRGESIAKRAKIVRQGDAWLVPSQSGTVPSYRVSLQTGELHCTCADFELRAQPCKHIYAAAIFVQRQTVTETTTPQGEKVTTTVTETAAAVRVSYPQNWKAYNAAQTAEKELFCHLWRDLCSTVPQPEQKKGRPRVPVADALFVAGYKVYSGMSGRRFATDVREAHAAGLIGKAYHFNTVLGVIEDESLAPALHSLVEASAAPLRSVETTFAVDSTGFRITQYYRHFTAKWGGAEIEQHDWLKLHALVGTNTNVIAAARITDRNANDSPHFAPLLLRGAESFDIHNVVADKAYGSRKNVALVAEIGANPWIALRSNAQSANIDTIRNVAPSRDTMAWRWLWHMYNLNRDDFLTRYHARSNAESTFSAMKRVFGDTLRSKGRAAQENELLLKVIAYNITCLIHSIFRAWRRSPRPDRLHTKRDCCTQTGWLGFIFVQSRGAAGRRARRWMYNRVCGSVASDPKANHVNRCGNAEDSGGSQRTAHALRERIKRHRETGFGVPQRSLSAPLRLLLM